MNENEYGSDASLVGPLRGRRGNPSHRGSEDQKVISTKNKLNGPSQTLLKYPIKGGQLNITFPIFQP